MSPQGEEGATTEVLVGVEAAAVLPAHSVHEVGGQHKGGPLSLETLDVGRHSK